MTRSSTSEPLEKCGFREWLEAEGIAEKVASDYLSRCKRVEAGLGVSLAAATSTEEAFVQLMIDIHGYAKKGDTVAWSRANASLRAAVRKFAQFAHGKRVERYPRNYGLTSYR